MKIVMTAKEYEETKKKIELDPCQFIDCTSFSCDFCPLGKVAPQVREAQENFKKVLELIYLEE